MIFTFKNAHPLSYLHVTDTINRNLCNIFVQGKNVLKAIIPFNICAIPLKCGEYMPHYFNGKKISNQKRSIILDVDKQLL